MMELLDFLDHFTAARSGTDGNRLLRHFLEQENALPSPLTLSLLLGRTPTNRISVPALKSALLERVELHLFEASKPEASDLSETIGLLWPGGKKKLEIEDLDRALALAGRHERLKAVLALLDESDARSRDFIVRVVAGRFRSPVSPQQLRLACADLTSRALPDIQEVFAHADQITEEIAAWLFDVGERPPVASTHYLSIPLEGGSDKLTLEDYDQVTLIPPGHLRILSGTSGKWRLFTLKGDEIKTELNTPPPPAIYLVHCPAGEADPLVLDILHLDGADLRNLMTSQRQALLAEHLTQTKPLLLVSAPLPLSSADTLAGLFKEEDANMALLHNNHATLLSNDLPLALVYAPPKRFRLIALYVEGSIAKRGPFLGTVTLGANSTSSSGKNEPVLLPVGKLSAKTLAKQDQQRLANFIRSNTIERFGPVRQLSTSPDNCLVLDVEVQTIEPAPRRKAGLLLKDPKPVELETGSQVSPTTGLDELSRLALL